MLEYMKRTGKTGVVVGGRPYHLDSFTGSTTICNILSSAGYPVFSADSISHLGRDIVEKTRLINMFGNDANIINAAKVVSQRADMAFIHVVSFGCSISPETDDEIKVFSLSQNPKDL